MIGCLLKIRYVFDSQQSFLLSFIPVLNALDSNPQAAPAI